jgi:molybdate transport system substrate-binding protein
MSEGVVMKRRTSLAAATTGFALLLFQVLEAEGAEVKVIAGVAIQPVLEQLGPQFERATSHKLVIWYGVGGPIRRRMAAGEAFDVIIVGKPALEDYIRQGKIAADTHTPIARVGMGVAASAGSPKRDVSSAEALKRVLLDAKSLVYNPEGAAGIHLVTVLERLGISEQVKPKMKPVAGGGLQAVAAGTVELGFAFTNQILSTAGVQLVGPFPPELQRYNSSTAGVATAAQQPEAAKALIKFLTSPAAAAVIKAKGMELPNS